MKMPLAHRNTIDTNRTRMQNRPIMNTPRTTLSLLLVMTSALNLTVHAQQTERANDGWFEVKHFDLINGTEELIRIPLDREDASAGDGVHLVSEPYIPEGLEVAQFPPELLKGFGAYTGVSTPTTYPYSTVCKLWITMTNWGLIACSGVLVGPRHVLTSGDCVMDAVLGQYTTPCNIEPGYNFGIAPFGSHAISNVWVANGWLSNYDPNYNLALIRLTVDVGQNAGWMGYGYAANDNWWMNASPVKYNIGYPSTNDQGTPVYDNGERMYFRSGDADYVANDCANCMCHNQPGYRGMGGGGLYYYMQPNQPFAMGVHTAGSNSHTCYTQLQSAWVEFMNSIIVSVPENTAPSFTLAPNPAQDHVRIESAVPIRNVQLLDAAGRVLEAWNGNDRSLRLNIDGSAPGLYVVRTSTDLSSTSRTLIVGR